MEELKYPEENISEEDLPKYDLPKYKKSKGYLKIVLKFLLVFVAIFLCGYFPDWTFGGFIMGIYIKDIIDLIK